MTPPRSTSSCKRREQASQPSRCASSRPSSSPLISILEPSEAFRAPLDYYAHSPQTGAILRRLAEEKPTTLACMHGSAWRGDGANLLRALAERLGASARQQAA
jgi:hypothetical protein